MAGSPCNIKLALASTDKLNCISSEVGEVTGALDNVSATVRFFPGTCTVCKMAHVGKSRKSHRKMLYPGCK